MNVTARRHQASPVPVGRALRKLGHDIRDARRRRRIPVAIMAERASISRMTLNKVEKGEPGVSMGTYATVLFALGMADRLADLADPERRRRAGARRGAPAAAHPPVATRQGLTRPPAAGQG